MPLDTLTPYDGPIVADAPAAGVVDLVPYAGPVVVGAAPIDAEAMATRGMTAGLSDYVGAAGRYAGDLEGRGLRAAGVTLKNSTGQNVDESFNDALKGIRAGNAAYRESDPVKAYGFEIAGGVVSPLYRGVTQLVDKGTQALGKGMALVNGVPRYVGFAAQGAGAGALAGAGNAEGQDGGVPTVGDLTKSTGLGTIGGAFLGVAAPAALEGAASGIRTVVQPAVDRFAQEGAESAAARKVFETLKADKLTPEMAQAKLNARGPQAMLADVSPGMTGLAEDVAQVRGPAQTAAVRNLTSRQGTIMSPSGAGARLADNIQKNLSDGDFYGAIDTLSKQRSVDARPLYEAAFSPSDTAPIKSPLIDRLMTRPVFQQGLRKGVTDALDEAAITGEDTKPFVDYFHGENFDDPNIVIKKAPSLRILDAAKRGLDSIIQGGGDEIKNSITGKLTQRGMRIDQMRGELVKELDNLTGGEDGAYAQARKAWAGPSKQIAAADAGRKLISTGDDEMVASALSKMSDGEKEAYRVGASKALQDMIDNTPDGANIANKLFGKQGLRDKLEAVFPDRASFNDFRKQVMTELSFSNTKNQVLGNSATARRLIGQQQVGLDPTGPAVKIATGRPGSGLIDLALQGWKKIAAPNAKTAAELAPLFSRDPAQQAAFLQSLRSRAAATRVFGNAGAVADRLAPVPALSPLSSRTGGSNQ